MTEHYPKSTESVTKWCNRCSRPTQHAVSNGRVGRCMEIHPESEATKRRRERKAEKRAAAAKQLDLF